MHPIDIENINRNVKGFHDLIEAASKFPRLPLYKIDAFHKLTDSEKDRVFEAQSYASYAAAA